MRLTQQLLRSKTSGPLSSVQLVDLSNLEILSIERLGCCTRLRTLVLRGNNLQSVSNIDCCHQLWNLDVSNNDIRCLVGLSRFMALGSLVLANNDLSWSELSRIKHIHILELTLLGNPRLERDPFCKHVTQQYSLLVDYMSCLPFARVIILGGDRIHVIDCLPHVWMLDGKLITSTERLQVEHFFQASALTSHPVRHKLPKDRFIPSALKNINVTGIYGEKATHLLRRFQAEGPINSETDKRRIEYLAYNLQQDLLLWRRSLKKKPRMFKFQSSFMETILAGRPKCLEQCNMLLLLLVASLEFSLPAQLMKETLHTSKLDKISEVQTMDLFLFPRDIRCHLVTILMNAVKVDKDRGLDGGLYGTLYHCLDNSVSELNRLRYLNQTGSNTTHMSPQHKDYKCLLASEVVQLLCIVPAFFQYLDKDPGVKSLLTVASKNPKIIDEILVIAKTAKASGFPVKEICEQVASFIVEKVDEQLESVVNKKVKLFGADKVFKETRALPIKRPNSVSLADYHMTGKRPPDREPPKLHPPPSHGPPDATIFPHLGDKVLLGPQTVAKVVNLPQPFLALVQMDTVPDDNGAMVTNVKKADMHYTYVDMTQFKWRFTAGVWKPRGTIGDRETDVITSILARDRNDYGRAVSLVAYHSEKYMITIQRLDHRWLELEEAGFLPFDTDGIGRPNSPVSGATSPPKSPRSPKSPRTGLSEDRGSPDHGAEVLKPRRRQRPMSAVLKEKLKLNLDLSKRPKSAVVRSTTTPTAETSDDNPDRMLESMICHKPESDDSEEKLTSETEISPPGNVTEDTGSYKEARETCSAQCQTEARPTQPAAVRPTPDVTGDEACLNDFSEIVTISEDPNEKTVGIKENAETLDEQSSVQAEARGITTSQGETTTVVTDTDKVTSLKPQQVAISLPRVELTDSLNTSKDESISMVGSEDVPEQKHTASPRPTPMSSPREHSRVIMDVLESRPYSAVEAYKYVVHHSDKGSSSHYQRPKSGRAYPRQRSAPPMRYMYKPPGLSTQMVVSKKSPGTGMASTYPTGAGVSNPVTSDPKTGRQGVFNLTIADNWLANGRDVYTEMMEKRPKSGYTPGWKETMPKNQKRRPRTAMVSTQTSREWDFNQSAHIRSEMAYYDLLQVASPRDSLQLPDLPSLSDYMGSARDPQPSPMR